MRLATGLRLEASIVHPHKCKCGIVVDALGRHGLSCKYAKGTYPRHLEINKILGKKLCKANVASSLEPLGLNRDSGLQPDGITLFPWSMGKCLVWDYTCHDTLCQSSTHLTSNSAGKAAEKAEKDKHAKYRSFEQKFIVQPIADETLGSWGPEGVKFVKEIGARMITATKNKRSTSELFQAISVATQRGNALSIIGSLPHPRFLFESDDHL